VETLRLVTGDATTPTGEGNKIIAHICNDIGGWGKGFVVAISLWVPKIHPASELGGRLAP
jgi:hypothetical protein